jgi:hypothetical protein
MFCKVINKQQLTPISPKSNLKHPLKHFSLIKILKHNLLEGQKMTFHTKTIYVIKETKVIDNDVFV